MGRIPFGQRASAIVSGGEELTAQVVNVYTSSAFAFDSYTGIHQGATTALHAPLLHRNLWDLWSKMVVHNTGAQDARIQVEYIARVGTGCLTPVFTVPKNGSKEFDLRYDMGCSSPPVQFQGAAQIRNLDARPLTGVVIDTKDVGLDGVLELRRSYELIFEGRSPAYVPTIKRNYIGRNTGLYAKDLSYVPESVFVNYRSSSGTFCGPDSVWLDGNGTAPFSPSPSDAACPPAGSAWLGAAVVTHPGIAMVVNHADPGTNRASMYGAVNQPARTVIVPLVLQNASYFGRSGWTTQIRAQNTSTTEGATIRIWYYTAGGQFSTSILAAWVSPGAVATFSGTGLSNFAGSAVIEASQPIAVTASYDVASPPDIYDYNMSMTGVHR